MDTSDVLVLFKKNDWLPVIKTKRNQSKSFLDEKPYFHHHRVNKLIIALTFLKKGKKKKKKSMDGPKHVQMQKQQHGHFVLIPLQ